MSRRTKNKTIKREKKASETLADMAQPPKGEATRLNDVQRAGVERDLREALHQNLGDDVVIGSVTWDPEGYACMAVGRSPEPHGDHDVVALAVYQSAPQWPRGRIEVRCLSLRECRTLLPVLAQVVATNETRS